LDHTDTYGSDQNGLVWAYRFSSGEAPLPLEADTITSDPSSAPATGTFLWLHGALANTACERWLRKSFRLPEAYFRSLTEQAPSTRLELDDDMLIAVLHDAAFDFTFDPENVSTVHLCLTPQLLITARLRPVRSVERLRATVRSGQAFRSIAELLAHLLRQQAEVLTEILGQAARSVDSIEDNLLANRIAASRRDLGTLRRTLVRFQRLLAPEPSAFFRLLARPPGWMSPDDLQDLRQAAEEFAAATADGASLIERVKLLQEELAAVVGEETNRTLFVLTLVTVLALPINLAAALLGMNVGGIPWANHPHGFSVVVTLLAIFTGLIAYVVMSRRRD